MRHHSSELRSAIFFERTRDRENRREREVNGEKGKVERNRERERERLDRWMARKHDDVDDDDDEEGHFRPLREKKRVAC